MHKMDIHLQYIFSPPHPPLQLAGSLAGVRGELSFIGNNAENVEGGALYISAFGQVKLYQNSHLNFINNTGRCVCVIMSYFSP